MNTTMSRGLVRFIAGPVAAASIIAGALGLAAVANATVAINPHAPVVSTQQTSLPNATDTLRDYRDTWSSAAQKRQQ
jgi:hypothetical protein